MAVKVAVVQDPPVLLDRERSFQKAVECIDKAAQEEASLLVFPEVYLPGYPTWIWRLKTGGDIALTGEIHSRLRQNAIDPGGNDLASIQEAAAHAAGPIRREKGILYAEIDVEAARRSLDPCGHYARPDVFSLTVNRKPQQPVEFMD